MQIDLYALIAVIVITAIALTIDIRSRRIPNWLTVSGAAMGLLYHVMTGGFSGLVLSLCGFGTGFGFLLVLWLIGGGGGGDVKLMGAVGAWLGALPTLLVFIGSALFAVICTLAVIVWSHYRNRDKSVSTDVETAQTSVLKRTIPYAVPVAMAIWSMFVFQILKG